MIDTNTHTVEVGVEGRAVEVRYVTNGALSGGDYGGAGYIAHVNCKVLEDEHPETTGHGLMGYRGLERAVENSAYIDNGQVILPDVIILEGGHGSIEGYALEDSEAADMVTSLEDYPVLSDDALSEYETAALDEMYLELIDEIRDSAMGYADAIAVEHCLTAAERDELFEAICALSDEEIEEMARDYHDGDFPFDGEHEYRPFWVVRDLEGTAVYVAKRVHEERDTSAAGVALRHRRENLTIDILEEI